MDFVITLVHGTRFFFMGKPTWHKPEGEFASRLLAKMQIRGFTGNVTFKSFGWRGSSAVSARLGAAEDLMRHAVQIRTNPATKNAKHVVIAHSHGGYVSLMASLAKRALLDAHRNGIGAEELLKRSARWRPKEEPELSVAATTANRGDEQ